MTLEWFNQEGNCHHYFRKREKKWCPTLAELVYNDSAANVYLYSPYENKIIGASIPNAASLEEAKLWVESRVRLEGWI